MLLSFKRQFPDGTPTYFIEKIWRGLFINQLADGHLSREFDNQYKQKFGAFWDGSILTDRSLLEGMKFHTIRAGARWKPGHKIHFCINARTPDYFQFAPVMPVQAVQAVAIKWTSAGEPCLWIDGKLRAVGHDAPLWATLAHNDGFPDTAAFFKWFRNDFEGQIIHWTPLKY